MLEFVDGIDLGKLVKANGKLAAPRSLQYILQAAAAIEYAHAQGIVHRDVKPGNLLLDSKGQIKLLDLGLARIGTSHDELTGSGQMMGTIDYMAPEQALKIKQADPRSDIYSLGATFWYLLTGRVMFDGEGAVERLMAHQVQPVPWLREQGVVVSPALESTLRRMVAKDPGARFQSMTECRQALLACQGSEAVAEALIPQANVATQRSASDTTFAEVARRPVEKAASSILVADNETRFQPPSPALEALAKPIPAPVATMESEITSDEDTSRVTMENTDAFFDRDELEQLNNRRGAWQSSDLRSSQHGPPEVSAESLFSLLQFVAIVGLGGLLSWWFWNTTGLWPVAVALVAAGILIHLASVQSHVAPDEAQPKALGSRFVMKKLGGVAMVVTLVIVVLMAISIFIGISLTAFHAVYIEQVSIETIGPLILIGGSIAAVCIGVVVSYVRRRLKGNRRDDSRPASRYDDD